MADNFPDYTAVDLKVLKMSVEELELGVRASNVFKIDGVKTIGDLIKMSDRELLRMPNFGEKSLKEVKYALSLIGVVLPSTEKWQNPMAQRLQSKKRRKMPRQQHERIGDAPVESPYQKKMNAMMQALDEFVNDGVVGDARRTGIIVMLVPFGNPNGTCNFMSNGIAREDLSILFQKMVARVADTRH